MIGVVAHVRCDTCDASRTIHVELAVGPINKGHDFKWADLAVQDLGLPEGWRFIGTPGNQRLACEKCP